MKSIRINTVINDENIKLFKELEGYQGKKAEIIINFKEEHEDLNRISVAGALSKYADVDKIKSEKSIWEKIAKDRHGLH